MSPVKPGEKHPTSAIYANALSELRDNHREEFEVIYNRRLDEASMVLHATTLKEKKAQILELIRERSGEGLGPTWFSKNLEIPISSAMLWLNELTAEGKVIPPGSGYRGGYRIVGTKGPMDGEER